MMTVSAVVPSMEESHAPALWTIPGKCELRSSFPSSHGGGAQLRAYLSGCRRMAQSTEHARRTCSTPRSMLSCVLTVRRRSSE